jgi:hypothetical protein
MELNDRAIGGSCMSRLVTFEIYFEAYQDFSIPEIIEMYLSNGWCLDDFGRISLRPLGDKDDFDWVELKLDQKNVLYEIIRKKVEVNEDPAIVLRLSNTEDSIVTTFFPREKRINFLLMGKRSRHPELHDWTDINWYIVYIYKPLVENGVGVSRIKYSETV